MNMSICKGYEHSDPFYIRDCFDVIVGNPKGYRTIRGAIQQANSKHTAVFKTICQNYDKCKKQHEAAGKVAPNLVNSIKQQGA